jgi:hypothetical protein
MATKSSLKCHGARGTPLRLSSSVAPLASVASLAPPAPLADAAEGIARIRPHVGHFPPSPIDDGFQNLAQSSHHGMATG